MGIIYAIPGIGATEKLFQNIAVTGYNIKVLSWPPTEDRYTLQDYAKEFLRQIDTGKPVNLMGVSFGGMLCSALAKQIKVKKLVLISSCGSSKEFPFLLKLMHKFPVYRLVSEKLIRQIAKTKRESLGFEKSFEPEFHRMINDMPENYFSRCINYIINWDEKETNGEIVHIHGTKDNLLTYTQFKKVHLIKNGSHAMILNKAAEINTILNKEFNGS